MCDRRYPVQVCLKVVDHLVGGGGEGRQIIEVSRNTTVVPFVVSGSTNDPPRTSHVRRPAECTCRRRLVALLASIWHHRIARRQRGRYWYSRYIINQRPEHLGLPAVTGTTVVGRLCVVGVVLWVCTLVIAVRAHRVIRRLRYLFYFFLYRRLWLLSKEAVYE